MARILVVEDENEVAAIFIDALTAAGHEAERSATAYGSVLRIVHGAVFDLILMDISLRGLSNDDPLDARREEKLQANGIVLTMALRWLGVNVPIIIVTGGVTRVDKEMVDRAKIDGILIKPVVPRDLLPEIARHLKGKPRE